MSLVDKFIEEFESLPEDKRKKVIEYIELLKVSENKNLDEIMDKIIDDNLESFRELSKV